MFVSLYSHSLRRVASSNSAIGRATITNSVAPSKLSALSEARMSAAAASANTHLREADEELFVRIIV